MDNNKINAIKIFIREISTDVNDYQALLKVLNTQHTLMTQRDSVRLEQIATKYQNYLAKLENRAAQRSQLLITIGVSSDPQGVEKLITALPDSIGRPLRSNWDKLQIIVQQCQAQNERNSTLLSMQQGILSELTQQSAPLIYDTYAPE
ncbi:flagellar export chaperone FlgN [Vibrio sp.]|uniref:flagellar export chaperone FlgN n=1 Tax=Vibrio sp. TaxID=678 RepID=UPI0037B9CF19